MNHIEKWKRISEFKIPNESKSRLKLSKLSTKYLFEIGMPEDVFDLCFRRLEENITSVNKNWDLEEPYFDRYLEIGFNGSGDPVVINIKNDEIVYLNHDNYFKEIFINSNLDKFAQCSLLTTEFQNSMIKLNENSLFETEYSDTEFECLKKQLIEIEPTIIKKDSYWEDYLNTAQHFRDEERRNS